MTKKEKTPTVPKLQRDLQAHRDLHGGELTPGLDHPFCLRCGLCNTGNKPGANCFIEPRGSTEPLVTVIFDGVSKREADEREVAAAQTSNGNVRRQLEDMANSIGFPVDRIRYLPMTRCANRGSVAVNYETKGKWCRAFVVEDVAKHPPQLIMPVGTVALKLLSYKGNAQDWGGKLLTYRGWPDDWMTDPRYDQGHPTAGPKPLPGFGIPIWAVQAWRLIAFQQNARVTAKWRGQMRQALELASSGVEVPTYTRPYLKFMYDPEEILDALYSIPEGVELSYDTETTGLLAYARGAKIVAFIFRYDGPDGPVGFAFPWDYAGSPLEHHVKSLTPVILGVLYRSRLVGQNLTFDIMFAYATLVGADLRKLTEAMACDTRHLIYTLHQSNESMGLDLMAYKWVPEMAGYEEEFELLKKRKDLASVLDPAARDGGHYAKALDMGDGPRKAFEIYALGDGEVTHWAAARAREKLLTAHTYSIPIADPKRLGMFRYFDPPPRRFAYERIMLPASRALARMMGNGLYVDQAELAHQEGLFPKLIREARADLRKVDNRVVQWCEEQEATVKGWKLDLEKRDQLKHVLFTLVGAPVRRLTKTGIKVLGEDLTGLTQEQKLQYAAVDKYTINATVAENPSLKPLQDYRKVYKSYTTFVRSMRNLYTADIDKKERTKDPYLMPDGCVHTTYNQAGTRSGRMTSCVSGDTVLETSRGPVRIEDLDLSLGPTSVLTHANRWQRILSIHWKGVQPMYRVTARVASSGEDRTDKRHTVVCTKAHRIFTQDGWRPVSDLKVGSKIITYTGAVERENTGGKNVLLEAYSCGETLCRPVFGSAADGHGFDPHGYNQEGAACYSEVLEAAESSTPTADRLNLSSSALCFSSERKKERPPTNNNFGPGKTGRVPQMGLVIHADCQGNGYNRIFGEPKHSTPRIIHSAPDSQFLSDSVHDAPNRGDRQGMPRHAGGFRQFREGPYRFCKKVIQRLSETSLASLFFEERNARQGRIWEAQGPYSEATELVDQISRDCHIAGVGGEQHTAYPGVHISWGETGGLCHYWHQHLGGDRWRLSPEGERFRARLDAQKNGVPSFEVHSETGCANACPSCGINPEISVIESITFEDYLGVWDISVEEDQSYVAHGFIHHNSKPNLAQLSRDSIIKRMYGSRFGKAGCIVQFDLSQIELRLIAALSGDKLMVDAYRRGIDLHSLTASHIYKTPYEHFLKDYFAWLQKHGREKEAKVLEQQRSTSKTTNFLTGYGGGAFGLQTTLAEDCVYLELDECERLIDAFFDTYPTMRRHIGIYKRFILDHRCAVSMFGRVRPLPEVESEDPILSSKALRAGYNHLVQSTASDMLLTGLGVIDQAMFDAGLESKPVNTVYDSVAIDTRRDELERVCTIADEVLNNLPEVLELALGEEFNSDWTRVVPLSADGEVGLNYLDQMKLDSFKDASGQIDWDKALAKLAGTIAA